MADQSFNLGTATVTLDGTGTDFLPLPRLPVVNAGTVNVGGTAVTDYVVDTDRGALIRKLPDEGGRLLDDDPLPSVCVWPAGRQNIEVTYEHGYATADLPRSVRMVALHIASRLVIQGVAQYETVGDVQMRYGVNATDLTDGERRILRKYRDGTGGRLVPLSTFLNGRPPDPAARPAVAVLVGDAARCCRSRTPPTPGAGYLRCGRPAATVPCRIDPLSGGEEITANRISDESTHLVTVPAGTRVIANQRFAIVGRGTFDITVVREATGELARTFEVNRS